MTSRAYSGHPRVGYYCQKLFLRLAADKNVSFDRFGMIRCIRSRFALTYLGSVRPDGKNIFQYLAVYKRENLSKSINTCGNFPITKSTSKIAKDIKKFCSR